MGKYQNMIVEFMKEKQKILDDFGISKPRYFTGKDKRAILRWFDFDARRVWKLLKYNIFTYVCSGLDATVCPFCIKNGVIDYEKYENIFLISNCDICEYSRVHRKCCDDVKSDWYKITELLNDNANELFSNEVYIKIIEKIEKKFGGDSDEK